MSKSLGNAIDPFALAERIRRRRVRYFLLREAPFGSDFSLSRREDAQRHNSDLGNDLGNLLRRSLAMLAKYRDGTRAGGRANRRSANGSRDLGDAADDADLRAGLSRRARDDLGTRHRAQSRDRRTQAVGTVQAGPQAELDALLYDLCEGLRWLARAALPVHAGQGDRDVAAARPRRPTPASIGAKRSCGAASPPARRHSPATRSSRASKPPSAPERHPSVLPGGFASG